MMVHSCLPDNLHDMIAQYHAPQTKLLKEAILKNIASGQVRLIFATEVFRMGADIKDIRRVIHITCPSSIETYLH